MKLVKSNDKILRQQTEPFNFADPQTDPHQLALDMTNTMSKAMGMGLSAPQVGLPYSVCVVGNPTDPDSAMALFNPKIVDYSSETDTIEENNLTFPGLFIKIKRSTNIRVRYTNADGQTQTVKFDGVTARLVQQQVDQLNGCLYTSRANSYHREQAYKQQKKLNEMRKRNAQRAI